MICYVCVSVFRQVLRLPFWFNVYVFLFTRKFYGYCSVLFCKVGRQMEIKNLFIQRTCIIYALMFSPTKNSMQCEIQVQIEKYSFKSSSSGCIKLMAYVYGFKETYYDSSRGCEEKLIYCIIYHFYATAASACYVHTIQNINVTVWFLLPTSLNIHTHKSIKSTISLFQYP